MIGPLKELGNGQMEQVMHIPILLGILYGLVENPMIQWV
jgi:hypothetical protein